MRLILLAIAMLAIVPGCIEGPRCMISTGYKEKKLISKELPVDPRGALEVENGAGTIEISRSIKDKNQLKVEAYKRAETEADLARVEPKVTVAHQSAIVRTKYTNRSVNAVIDYTIYTPSTITLKNIQTGSGSVCINEIEGDMKVQTGSGRIDIANAGGAIDAHTGSGAIIISQNSQAKGAIRARTSSGRIDINNAVGPIDAQVGSGSIHILCADHAEGAIKASTGSGRIEIYQSIGNVWATTGSGTIIVQPAQLPDKGTVELKTSSGRIELRLPKKTHASISVMAPRGRLHSEFFIKDQQLERGQITGKIGKGGDLNIVIHSATGNITLVKM